MKFILFASISFLFFSCVDATQKKASSVPFLPSNASIIIKTNDLKKLKSDLTNNSLYQNNKTHVLSNHFKNIEPLSILETNQKDIFICYSPLGKSEMGTTIVTSVANVSLSAEELSAKTTGNFTYNKHDYTEISLENQSFFATKLDSLWVATDHKLLLENSIREFQNEMSKDQKLEESLLALDNNKSFSVLLKNDRISELRERLLPNYNSEISKNFSGWSALDFSVEANYISFDGVYKPKDSIYDYTALFSKTNAQSNELIRITPTKLKSVTSFSFDNFEQLSRNLAIHNGKELNFETDALDDFLNETNEFGVIELESEKLVAFTLLDEELDIDSYFDTEGVSETYRDTSIYKLNVPINIAEKLQPLIAAIKDVNFYFQIDEFIVFAENSKGLKSLISSIKNEDILSENEWFEDFSEEISSESSLLYIQNVSDFKNTITNGVNEAYTKDWEKASTKGYRLSALQLTADTNFTHLHYVVSKSKAAKIEGKVNQTGSVFLDAELINGPQLVKNYINKGMDAVVQDKNNQLSLLSNTGKIEWQKNIGAPILGNIQQMDMYRNGRLQLVFTTEKALYVLDRKGNDVAPFPIKFENPITQPVAVFDYDKNRKYRIAIVQNDNMSLYDQKGKRVNGFKFKNKTNGSITQVPKHIRVGSKDYILVNESNSGLHILSRTGKERIKLKQKTLDTENNWYWYKNAFTTITADNLITQVNTKGAVNKIKPVKQGEDIKIDATSKTLAAITENTLTIKGKKVNLDYGVYTDPKIFYINNKIFVSVTDTQTSKVYLFDSNAKPISGFPIYGNSLIDMGNMDTDNALEVVTKGDKNNVLIYEFR